MLSLSNRWLICWLLGAGLAIAMNLAVPPRAVEAGNVAHGKDCASCHSLAHQEAAALLKPLGLTVKTVRQSPVSGLFEVVADKSGKEGIIYVDYGKKLLMQGVIIDAGELQAAAPAVKRQPAEKSPKP